jgi:hypothetical protein
MTFVTRYPITTAELCRIPIVFESKQALEAYVHGRFLVAGGPSLSKEEDARGRIAYCTNGWVAIAHSIGDDHYETYVKPDVPCALGMEMKQRLQGVGFN